MDVLTDVLKVVQLNCSLLSRTEINPPWRFYFSAGPDATFHIIFFGEGFVWVDGEKTSAGQQRACNCPTLRTRA